MLIKWWIVPIFSPILFIVLFFLSFQILEKLLPVYHMPYDFGGSNMSRAIPVAFLLTLIIAGGATKEKKLPALVLTLFLVGATFLFFFASINPAALNK